MKTNERHHNPRPVDQSQENWEKKMVRNTFVSVFWMGWPFGVPHHNPKEPRPNPRKFREKNVGRNTHCLVNENERTSYLTRGHNPADEKPEKKKYKCDCGRFWLFLLGLGWPWVAKFIGFVLRSTSSRVPGTHFKTTPWQANKRGLVSTLVVSLF